MTHSGDPLTISGMRERNRRLEAPVRDFLKSIVERPPDHARFMNMLSMLEHKGSRKIMLSQMDGVLTEDILKHLAEEARHAYFFKRQAERIAGRPLDGYTEDNTMARVPALMYFGRLDAGISRAVAQPSSPSPLIPLPLLPKTGEGGEGKEGRKPRQGEGVEGQAPYPWVSLVIELRACWLYAIYHDVLEKSGVKLSLKSLIAEEDMHLVEMFGMCGGDTEKLQALSAYETELFEKLWGAVSGLSGLKQAA